MSLKKCFDFLRFESFESLGQTHLLIEMYRM